MGRRKSTVLEDPPAAALSEEEEGQEEEEEEVSETENQEEEQNDQGSESDDDDDKEEEFEDDEEEEKPTAQSGKKSTTLAKKLQEPQPSSSDVSESEPEKPVKPIASKPMNKAKSQASQPSSSKKRRTRADESSSIPDDKISKKPKKQKGSEAAMENADRMKGEESSKKLFQRLWSEEDEITVLKGMIDYIKKGQDPMSGGMSAFHEFIRKSLQVEVSKAQLVDKVKRLKKKYVTNSIKGKNGEEPSFTKPHESKSYQLSKKIWGGADGDKSINGKISSQVKTRNVKEEGKKQFEVAEVKDDVEDIDTNVDVACDFCLTELVNGGLDEMIVKKGLESIVDGKRAEFEDQWRSLKVAEMELYLKRIDMIRDHSKVVLDAFKSSKY